MSMCEQTRPAPFRCPTGREVLNSILALLPRGRAWQASEGGPFAGSVQAFDTAFDSNGFQRRSRPGSVMMQFWQSIAEVVTFVNSRLCDLRLEFWCATQRETHDLWMAEYGLPDACDPFPDLCTKVAATGGTRCEYYAMLAARSGWSISCVDGIYFCGTRVGDRRSKAGIMKPGRRREAYLAIVVDLGASSAFTGTAHAAPRAGRLKAGRRLGCGPNIDALVCLLSRVVHAEIEITYRMV